MIVYNKKTNKLEASGPGGYNGLPFDNGCGGIVICFILLILMLIGIKYNLI